MVFMRRRIEMDLQDLLNDPEPDPVTQRTFLGADLGASCAFLNFRIEPLQGPFRGASIPSPSRPRPTTPTSRPRSTHTPPPSSTPTKTRATNQLMFSFVDPQYWKPIFELKQVLCALDMVLLAPDLGYSSLKTLDFIAQKKAEVASREMDEEAGPESVYPGGLGQSPGLRAGQGLWTTCSFETRRQGFQSIERDELRKDTVRVNIGGYGDSLANNY
jgi:hypothetical protein